jgi:signal transduction histidine kinase
MRFSFNKIVIAETRCSFIEAWMIAKYVYFKLLHHINMLYISIINQANMKRLKIIFCLLLFFTCYHSANAQIQQINRELKKINLIKDSARLVESFNRLGELYRKRNADSCFYYGLKAKQLATNIKYKDGQIDADLLIAYSFYKRGVYAEALELLGKVLPYYQQTNDIEKVIRTNLDMVEVLNKGIADRPKIVSLLRKTIAQGEKLEKDSIMSQVYISYCNRNPNLSADSVNYYLNKSNEIAKRYNDEPLLLFNRLWRLRLVILSGQYEASLPKVQRLIADAKRIGDISLEVNAHFLLIGYADVNPRMALEHCYKAFEISHKNGDSFIEIYILNNALEIAKQLNDKDEIIKAYSELEKAMTADWEKSRKFMGDYVKYNNIQIDNQLLSEKTAQRTLWLIIISFLSAAVILGIYLIMLRQKRRVKAQIKALNDAANMQIIAMEEAKQQAVREEQRRLGQDLHDGLSSSIAAIKHQLEILLMDANDPELKGKLQKIQAETERAYTAARNKSHEWFSSADEQQEQSFENQIKILTDISLPDNRYNKTIQIDDNSLVGVDTDTRISLLRIIQEAVTNIIKHAKAKNIGILVYEEDDTLTLTINDDGVGLVESKTGNEKSSLGLDSIRRRVQFLNGETEIISNSKGTEINVSIPLAFKYGL